MGLLSGVGLMPICAVCEVRLEGYFFCRKKVRVFAFLSRVRPDYFGGGYFHYCTGSSEFAVIWVRFQHLVLRLLS